MQLSIYNDTVADNATITDNLRTPFRIHRVALFIIVFNRFPIIIRYEHANFKIECIFNLVIDDALKVAIQPKTFNTIR